jgi:hypothetical protein
MFERVSFTKYITKPGSLVVEQKRVSRKRTSGYSYVSAFGYLRNYEGRPFLRPALQSKENQQEILNILVRNINKALGS